MVWAILLTSLGVVVGLNNDLTGVTQDLNTKSFRTFEYFTVAAVLYYGISKLVTGSSRLIAWRLFRY
jgi:hydroxyproline transport system permease protein